MQLYLAVLPSPRTNLSILISPSSNKGVKGKNRHCQMKQMKLWQDASHHSWYPLLGETHIAHCPTSNRGPIRDNKWCGESLGKGNTSLIAPHLFARTQVLHWLMPQMETWVNTDASMRWHRTWGFPRSHGSMPGPTQAFSLMEMCPWRSWARSP